METSDVNPWLVAIVASITIVAAPALAEPVPRDVILCVGYLVSPSLSVPATERIRGTPVATGFFVSHQYSDVPGKTFFFLVTARHVIVDQTGKPRLLLLRVNETKSGKARDFGLPQPARWIFHSNPTAVDLAILPLLPRAAEIKFVPSAMFVTEDLVAKNEIGIGDEVFYLGLLPHYSGDERIVPIFRFGRLALTPDEKTVNSLFLHFLDANNTPGHSGSPVFLWASPQREQGVLVAGPRVYAFYGVVSNVLEYSEPLRAQVVESTDTKAVPLDYRSGGVTGIVPARYLLEVLNSDEARVASGLTPKAK